jgi:presenilin-like A22 family membrane protease
MAAVILSAMNSVSAQQTIAMVVAAGVTALFGLSLMIVPDTVCVYLIISPENDAVPCGRAGPEAGYFRRRQFPLSGVARP